MVHVWHIKRERCSKPGSVYKLLPQNKEEKHACKTLEKLSTSLKLARVWSLNYTNAVRP
jgi:hypothetical protein